MAKALKALFKAGNVYVPGRETSPTMWTEMERE